MFFPQLACDISKRYFGRQRLHFPKRPLTLSNKNNRNSPTGSLPEPWAPAQRVPDAGHLNRTAHACAANRAAKRLSECCCGAKEAQSKYCSLHRIHLPCSETRTSPSLGLTMTISRLHTNPAGLRNLGLRETVSEESATVCTLVEAVESQSSGRSPNFPRWDKVYCLVPGPPSPQSCAKSRKQET